MKNFLAFLYICSTMTKKKKISPVTPQEVMEKIGRDIPSEIIEAVNKLIVKEYKPITGWAKVYQDDILAIVTGPGSKFTKRQIFDNKWLDVEPVFERAGWTVKYYKPDYWEEPYPAYFTFEPKK